MQRGEIKLQIPVCKEHPLVTCGGKPGLKCCAIALIHPMSHVSDEPWVTRCPSSNGLVRTVRAAVVYKDDLKAVRDVRQYVQRLDYERINIVFFIEHGKENSQ